MSDFPQPRKGFRHSRHETIGRNEGPDRANESDPSDPYASLDSTEERPG